MRALSDRRGHFGKDYLSFLSISRRHAEIAGIIRGRERVMATAPPWPEEYWKLYRVRKIIWSMRKSAFGC
jgi:hypothetical protein